MENGCEEDGGTTVVTLKVPASPQQHHKPKDGDRDKLRTPVADGKKRSKSKSRCRSSTSASPAATPPLEKKADKHEKIKEPAGGEKGEERGRFRVNSLVSSYPVNNSSSKSKGGKSPVPFLSVAKRKRTISIGDGLNLRDSQDDTLPREDRTSTRSQDDSDIATRSKSATLGPSLSPRPLTSRASAPKTDQLEGVDTSSSDTESVGEELSRVSADISEMHIDLPSSFTDLSLAERVSVNVIHMLYNPRSGNRAGERVMRKARKLFEEKYNKTVHVTKLQYKGHAEELCETMSLDGIDILCSVGGDGTFHECTNGIMKRMAADGAARIPPMALIAAGTGNSFMHELGYAKLKDAVHHICRGVHVPIDIGKLTFGDGTTCYSFNSMHWGMASKVAVTAEKLRWMGTAIRYTTAALIEMMKGKTARARITITDGDDNVITYDEDFALAIANNIITAGKGMKMAPTAKLDDGLVDLLLITTASTLDMMTIFRKVYDGTHTRLPHVRYIKVKSFSIVPYRTISEEKREREKAGKTGSKSSIEHLPTNEVSSKKKADKEKDADRDRTPPNERAKEKEKEKGEEGERSEEMAASGTIEEIEELLDVDGELKGCTPFTCDVIPRALRVIL